MLVVDCLTTMKLLNLRSPAFTWLGPVVSLGRYPTCSAAWEPHKPRQVQAAMRSKLKYESAAEDSDWLADDCAYSYFNGYYERIIRVANS